MLPCTPSSSTNLGRGWEPRFGPLFLVFVRMMVSSGLAGAHVQPCPRNNIELRATSSELRAISFLGSFEARGS